MSEIVLKRNLQKGEVVYFTKGSWYSQTTQKVSPTLKKEAVVEKLFFNGLDGDRSWFLKADENGNPSTKQVKFHKLSNMAKRGQMSRDKAEVEEYLKNSKVQARKEGIDELETQIQALKKAQAKLQKELDEIALRGE
jgi:SMC interacting uncharacterized protein involved in chromosome segregation